LTFVNEQSKRALLLTDVTAPGGVDTYMRDLYLEGINHGWQVQVIIDDHPGSDILFAMLDKISAPVKRAPLYHRKNDPATIAWTVQKVIDDFSPNIFHAVCGAPWTTVTPRETAIRNKLPLVFTEQYVAPGFTFETPLKKRITSIYRKARRVIAVSKNNASLLTDNYGFPARKMIVIPNPVQVNKNSAHSKKRITKIRGSLPDKKYHILTVARCARQKGLDLLVDALALLPDHILNQIHFTVIGDGPLRESLENRAETNNTDKYISFLGWRDNVKEIYGAFDLFLLPSRSEGQPFALAEAMAAKVPTIATSVSGIPELLDNGKCGKLIKRESPLEIARAVISFVNNPAGLRIKAEYGYSRVKKYHDLKTNMKKTIAQWEG